MNWSLVFCCCPHLFLLKGEAIFGWPNVACSLEKTTEQRCFIFYPEPWEDSIQFEPFSNGWKKTTTRTKMLGAKNIGRFLRGKLQNRTSAHPAKVGMEFPPELVVILAREGNSPPKCRLVICPRYIWWYSILGLIDFKEIHPILSMPRVGSLWICPRLFFLHTETSWDD